MDDVESQEALTAPTTDICQSAGCASKPGEHDQHSDEQSDGAWEDVSDDQMDYDSEDIIELMKETLVTMAEDDPDRLELMQSLGHAFYERHVSTQAIADLNGSITLARQVVQATPGDLVERMEYLSDLGIRLGERYSRDGSTSDFDEANRILRQVAAQQSNKIVAIGALHGLGLLFHSLYSRTGELSDLEEALGFTRGAFTAIPEDDPRWLGCANNLGLRLKEVFLHKRRVEDLDEALQLALKVIEHAPEGHPDYPGFLTNRGALLGYKYSSTGKDEYLQDALVYLRKAVAVVPSNHPGEGMLLSNLAEHLGKRYMKSGDAADLDEAIKLLRQALGVASDNDPDRPSYESSLGVQLGHRYLKTGAVADLNQAILHLQEAISSTPVDHPHMATFANNLSMQLSDRFVRLGAIADIDEAIRILRQAIDATPETHVNSADLLANLGLQLGNLYSRSKSVDVLKEAIQVTQRSIEITPLDDPRRIVQLDSLAILQGKKHAATGSVGDLEVAIQTAREAVAKTPQHHLARGGVLNNLGDELGNLFQKTGNLANLDESITYLCQALSAMPRDDPERSAVLGNLGNQLDRRFERLGAAEDLRNAIECYQEALTQSNAYLLSRIWAGRGVLRCCAGADWQQAYAAASVAADLVPRISARSLQNADKMAVLSQVVGLASDAAAAALHAGQDALVALGLLEQGRGVLATALDQVRADISRVRVVDAELAADFLRLRDELEQSPQREQLTVEHSTAEDASGTTWLARHKRRYDAGREFDDVIDKIRALPMLGDFLHPPGEDDIKAAASYGPIIVVNASKYRCDALLIEPSQVRSLALPKLSMEEIERRALGGDLDSEDTLEWLWDSVAAPVLHALGFVEPPSEKWPHVWWIPTGPLSKFPLHAAGYHSAGSAETVLDKVMSSYATSVKSIIRDRRNPLTQLTGSAHVLLVPVENTPGRPALRYAAEEVEAVQAICESKFGLQTAGTVRRKEDVMLHLNGCSIFHFAGHGATDNDDASNSRIILEDAAISISELLELNLFESRPFLAYLSACGTGRIKDDSSLDESIHLISAFQLAGFRHVVGTLWEVMDELCVDMARLTYENFGDGPVLDASVCHGLHEASTILRDRWLQEEVAEVKEEGRAVRGQNSKVAGLERPQQLRNLTLEDARPSLWVPFVHYGV